MKYLRNLLVSTLLVSLVMALSPFNAVVLAEEDIRVIVNDQEVDLDTPPVIVDGRTLVPIRGIFEAMGAEVDWDGENRIVTVSVYDGEAKFTIDSIYALVDDEEYEMDVPAQIINGKTFLPLRFVSENLGADVDWDGDQRIVTITTGDYEPEEPDEPDGPDEPIDAPTERSYTLADFEGWWYRDPNIRLSSGDYFYLDAQAGTYTSYSEYGGSEVLSATYNEERDVIDLIASSRSSADSCELYFGEDDDMTKLYYLDIMDTDQEFLAYTRGNAPE